MSDVRRIAEIDAATKAYDAVAVSRAETYREVVRQGTNPEEFLALFGILRGKSIKEMVGIILAYAHDEKEVSAKHNYREFLRTAKFLDLKSTTTANGSEALEEEIIEAASYPKQFGAYDPPGPKVAVPLFRSRSNYPVAEYVRIRAKLDKKHPKNTLGGLSIELCERRACVIDRTALNNVHPSAIASSGDVIARSVLRKCDLGLYRGDLSDANDTVYMWRSHCWVKISI